MSVQVEPATRYAEVSPEVRRALKIKVYRVTLQAETEILGTRPKHPDVMRRWLEEQSQPGQDELEALAKAVVDSEDAASAREDAEVDRELARWSGFPTDPETDEIFLYNYQFIGALKEWANKYREQFGIQNMRAKVASHVFIQPRCIYLGITHPDAVVERPLRAHTAKGDRIALVKSDALAVGTRISFEVHLVPHKEITAEVLQKLFLFGRYAGTFQWRGGGYGQMSLLSFDLVPD